MNAERRRVSRHRIVLVSTLVAVAVSYLLLLTISYTVATSVAHVYMIVGLTLLLLLTRHNGSDSGRP